MIYPFFVSCRMAVTECNDMQRARETEKKKKRDGRDVRSPSQAEPICDDTWSWTARRYVDAAEGGTYKRHFRYGRHFWLKEDSFEHGRSQDCLRHSLRPLIQ